MASPKSRCAPQPRPRSLTEITREIDGSRGRYVLRRGGDEAELTYSITTPKLIISDHTGVPDSFRGTGAGNALALRLVTDARAEGVKIVPLCPFVNRWRARHPEWADVFQV